MLCAIARIDEAAKAQLSALCKITEQFGFPSRSLYGHITLVTFLGEKEDQFIQCCKDVLHGQTAFSVHYHHIELLPPTPSIVASPDLTEELLGVHQRLLEIAPSECDMWSHNAHWHPHTTLFYHTEAALHPILMCMENSFVPFHARISSIEFSKVTDTGYEIVESVALADNL